MQQIENILVQNKVMTLSQLKYLHMANKPAGVTDEQIDTLIDFYENL